MIKIYYNEFNNLALKINETEKQYKVMLLSKVKNESCITFSYPTKLTRMNEILKQCKERGFKNETRD